MKGTNLWAHFMPFIYFSHFPAREVPTLFTTPPLRHEAIGVCFVVNPPLKALSSLPPTSLDNLHY